MRIKPNAAHEAAEEAKAKQRGNAQVTFSSRQRIHSKTYARVKAALRSAEQICKSDARPEARQPWVAKSELTNMTQPQAAKSKLPNMTPGTKKGGLSHTATLTRRLQ